MPSGTRGSTKIKRIMHLYHILRMCDEVSFQEIDDSPIAGWSKKTIMRDIAILKKAGVDVRYSAKRKAYVMPYIGCDEQDFTENTFEARFMNKIKRLICFCDESPAIDCDKWYMENIPGATKRTMQHDFALLRTLGYQIWYQREKDWYYEETHPPRHYYLVPPRDLYEIYDRTGEIGDLFDVNIR